MKFYNFTWISQDNNLFYNLKEKVNYLCHKSNYNNYNNNTNKIKNPLDSQLIQIIK